MRRIVMLLAVLFSTGLAMPVVAQVQTGSILVKAMDQQNAVMPGATITISSPVLVSGTMTGVTDAGGVYRFPSLVPGTYTVKLDLQGFQSIVRQNVAVLVGQTTPVELQMKVATVAETVTVTGASPVVDTTSATQAVNLSEQILQATPGGRDIWALVEYKVPSLMITRPDVGGTSGGLQGTYNARGTNSSQNSQFLNGINVGDPSAIGAAGYYYDYDSFDDIQVSTGAHDITVPTGGVFLNMVTKSGGNTWSGRNTFAWEGKQTQSANVDANLLRNGFPANANQVNFVSDENFTLGGPLVANKLRIFGSFRDWRVHVNTPVALSQTVLDQTNITSGLVNLTYQLNDKNKLTGFWSRQRYNKPNRLLNSAAITVVDSTSDEEDVFNVYQALWNSIITPRLFMDARVGYNTILFPTYLNGTDESLTDTVTGIITRNNTANTVRHRPRLQANATFQYYVDQALGGRHEFKFGVDQTHAAGNVETTRFNDLTETYNSTTNQGVSVTLFATPFNTATTVDDTALFVQDSYSLKRLTVTAGVRFEHLNGYLPDQSSPATRWSSVGIPEFAANVVPRSLSRTNVVTWNNAGPRLSLIYDATGDGKTAIRGSAARYYYIIPTTGTPLDSVNPNSTYQVQYNWTDANHDLHFQPGEQTGTPVTTSGSTTTIDPGYRRPYTDEYTAGFDRDLGQALKLSVNYTYRREKYPQATFNPALPFSTTPKTAPDSGPDGVAGTADDTSYQFFDRLSGTNLTVVTNDPTSVQTYSGVEISGTKRFSNRWQMVAGLTMGRTRIDGVSVNTNPDNLINANGLITGQLGDRPYIFKWTGTYVLPFQEIGVSANFISESGIAVTRQVSQRLTVGGTTNINVEAPGSHRLDPRNQLDLRFAKSFKLGTSRSLEASVDIYNLTNSNVVWDVRTLSGTIGLRQNGDLNGTLNTVPQFLSPASILAPRIARFNIAIRF
jgi:hypothetical protein